jgi:predicted glycogen debranching enzyme
VQRLALSADSFLVQRGRHTSVIAGYPWFTDRGRDTAAAAPGLCLPGGHPDALASILDGLAADLKDGLLPGVYLESGAPPLDYVSDANLWFAPAVQAWREATRDDAAATERYLPTLRTIIEALTNGTRHGFHVEPDHLLSSGTRDEQVTWMNIRTEDDDPVTPRHGKAVEHNALWYNLLRITADLETAAGNSKAASALAERAQRHRQAFRAAFLDPDGDLVDVITPSDDRMSALRPHQALVIGLPHSLLDEAEAIRIMERLRDRLLTPAGLRSLSPFDEGYIPEMDNDLLSQDATMHKGAARYLFLTALITAIERYGKPADLKRSIESVNAFVTAHLSVGLLGHVAEMFNAADPHTPHGAGGCAWNTAEVLRVLTSFR